MKHYIKLFLALLISTKAYSATLTVVEGQELVVPVSSDGATIQLPGFVKIVTPAKSYYIDPLAAPSAPVGADGQPQAQSDVRAFTVRPAKNGASEKVTFILADEKAVSLHLTSGQAGDSFYDIKWNRQAAGSLARKDQGFLSPERSLMLSMLRDENIGARKDSDISINLDRYPDLKIKLLRTYQLQGLTGYVFTVTNKSDKKLTINPTVLTIGRPNRAILTHIDHEELQPCSVNSSPDPKGTGCVTALRMVVNGASTNQVKIGSNDRLGMPYTFDNKPAGSTP